MLLHDNRHISLRTHHDRAPRQRVASQGFRGTFARGSGSALELRARWRSKASNERHGECVYNLALCHLGFHFRFWLLVRQVSGGML